MNSQNLELFCHRIVFIRFFSEKKAYLPKIVGVFLFFIKKILVKMFVKINAFLLVVISVFVAIACKETKLVSKAKTMDSSQVELSFKNINTIYSENTKTMLRMKAPRQLRVHGGNERFPEGIEIEMYNPNGELRSTLIADSAIYFNQERVYRVMGNVLVQNILERKKLETDLLNWSKDDESVYTDSRVRITADGQILTGKGLRAKQDFSDYEVLEPEGIVSVRE